MRVALAAGTKLSTPEPTVGYVPTTDALEHAVGACLSQENGSGERPITFPGEELMPCQCSRNSPE